MKKNKRNFLLFILSVLGFSVVLFNNSIDLFDKIFNPIINSKYMFGFLSGIIGSTWYVVYNWNSKN